MIILSEGEPALQHKFEIELFKKEKIEDKIPSDEYMRELSEKIKETGAEKAELIL